MHGRDQLFHRPFLCGRSTVVVQNGVAVIVYSRDSIALTVQLVLVHRQAGFRVNLIDLLRHLGVKVNIQCLTVLIASELHLPARADEIVQTRVRLNRGGIGFFTFATILAVSLGFPPQVLHGVTTYDQDVGLRLHAAVVRIAEHDVDAIHQLHLNLAALPTKCTAIGGHIRVKEEVRTVVTCLCAVE